jgi:FkbM family methyltransferase
MALWRTALERAGRGKVVKRKLDRRFANVPIYISPDAGLRYLRWHLRDAEPRLLELAERTVKGGDIVWDIGANVGLFAFAAAATASKHGRVLAVEPDVWLGTLLARSSALPGDRAPVDVLTAAVSDDVKLDTLVIAQRGRSTNYLLGAAREDGTPIGTQSGGARASVLVPTLTLDWLLEHYQPPQVVKVDVEGAEALVVRGGSRVLNDVRPILIIEVGSASRTPVGDVLGAAGYRFYDINRDCVEVPRPVYDTLALPE